MQIKQKMLSTLINGLAVLLPSVSTHISYYLWTRTYRYPMPEKEKPCFDSAHQQLSIVDDKKVMTYSWQVDKNKPRVLLLHGWNGRATQFFAFVEALLDAGYSVIAFDACGHGQSDGNKTNIIETTAIIKQLSLTDGDFFAIIAHSFGALAGVNAMNQGIACQKIIMISSPTQFSALLIAFAEYLGLSRKATNQLEQFVLKKFSIPTLEEISTTGIAPRMKSACLIVHDKNDDRVPISQAEKALEVWSGAKLHKTEKLGHIRILHNVQVIKVCMSFLAESSHSEC